MDAQTQAMATEYDAAVVAHNEVAHEAAGKVTQGLDELDLEVPPIEASDILEEQVVDTSPEFNFSTPKGTAPSR